MKRRPLILCAIGFVMFAAMLLGMALFLKAPPPSAIVRFLQATNIAEEGCFLSFEMDHTS